MKQIGNGYLQPLQVRYETAKFMLPLRLGTVNANGPQDLIVYGGTGKAARNWDCFRAIVAALRSLENDETLLVQSGKPVGIFRTHSWLLQW